MCSEHHYAFRTECKCYSIDIVNLEVERAEIVEEEGRNESQRKARNVNTFL